MSRTNSSRPRRSSPGRVVLVQIVRRDLETALGSEVHAPIGPAYIRAVLEADGFDVPLLVHHVRERGRGLADRILDREPDLVGISATGNELHELADLSESLRDSAPALPLVAGGYCSMDAEGVLERTAVDAVVLGEGEQTVRELVPVLLEGGDLDAVAGIAYRDGSMVTRTKTRPAIDDLDELPLPRYPHFPAGSRSIRVYSSRGCPFECTFCRIKDYYETPRVRAHGSGYIERLVESLLERAEGPVEVVYFNDDEFLLLRQHFQEMAGLMRNLGLQMCFQTRTGDVVRHAELLRRHRGVVHQVHMGVESFSQSQLDRWHKRTTVDTNRRALKILSDARCSYYPYILLTDAHTTPAELDETVEGLLSLPPCPYEIKDGRERRTITLSPLHRGLHLNRMKDFWGRAERRSETAWLDELWRFLGRTDEASRRLASLIRRGFDPDPGPSRAAFDLEADHSDEELPALLDRRVATIATLARTLEALPERETRIDAAEAAAHSFNADAEAAAARSMVRAVFGGTGARFPAEASIS